MNEEQLQEEGMTPVDSEMTPEEAKASLGLATRLSEQFLMSQVPQEGVEGSPEAPEGSESEVPVKNDDMATQETPEKKMELKNEIRSIVQEEMANLRQDIQDALTETDETE